MKYFLLFFSLFFLLISCDNPIVDPPMQDPEMINDPDCLAIDEKSLDLVTGIRFFDENGNSIGQVGNPNVTKESPFSIYPNPNNGVIGISKQNDIEYDLFIIPCKKDTMCSDIAFDDYKFEYSIDSLYAINSTTIDLVTQNIQIQFQSDLTFGHYKLVFYNENEDLIIENIYYDPNKSVNEMIDFLNGEF